MADSSNTTPDPLTIRPGERGIIRLFTLDMPPEQVRFLAEPGAIAQLLGVADLDPAHADIITLADLEDIGLAGYLTQGFAIPPDQIDHAPLDPLTGHALLIRSRAFKGQPAALTPDPTITLIATYSEPSTDWSATPIETASAKPRVSPRAARSQARRIGFSLFAVIMTLVIAFVVWLAT